MKFPKGPLHIKLKIALANHQAIVIVLRQWEALFKTEPLSNQSKSV